jgi:hypothetical protein
LIRPLLQKWSGCELAARHPSNLDAWRGHHPRKVKED